MRTTCSIAVAATLLLAGCGEATDQDSGPGELSGSSSGLSVSSPVPQAAGASGPAGSVAFVSVAPGTVAGAASAQVKSNGVLARTLLATDGGFDPVAVPAEAGDRVEVLVADSSGGTTVKRGTAQQRARPRVIRTSPASRKTDVPLNARMTVVFTTPMDSASVVGGVTLRAGGVAVVGSIELNADALVVEFTPATPLHEDSEYELHVAGSVRDVLGTTLGEDVVVGFRTAASPPAPDSIEISTTVPWNGVLAVGDMIYLLASPPFGSQPVQSQPVRWSSLDPTVLEFQYDTGEPNFAAFFQAVGVGRTTVRATLGNRVGEMIVEVVDPPPGTGVARLRVVHAMSGDGFDVMDVRIDGTQVVSNLPYLGASQYLELTSGRHNFLFRGGMEYAWTLAPGADYTALPCCALMANGQLLADDNSEPPAGQARLRFVDYASISASVNIYLTAPGADLASAVPIPVDATWATDYLTVPAGEYQIRVRAFDSDVIVLDSGPVTFGAGQVRTIIAVNTAEGGPPFDFLILRDRE